MSIAPGVLFYILQFKIVYQQQQYKLLQVDYLFYLCKVHVINSKREQCAVQVSILLCPLRNESTDFDII